MAYGIVSYKGHMPEHVKGAELIKYTPGQEPEKYQLKENVKYPGLHLIWKSYKAGIDYLVTPRELKGQWLLKLLGIKNEAVKPGTDISNIIRKLESQYKPKAELVPEPG